MFLEGCPVNVSLVVVAQEDPRLLGRHGRQAPLVQLSLVPHDLQRMATPRVRASVERVVEHVGDEGEPRRLEVHHEPAAARLGDRNLDLMVAKPFKGLPQAPRLAKLCEDQLNRLLHTEIGILDDLVLGDCCATSSDEMHRVALAELAWLAVVSTAEEFERALASG